MICRYLHCDKEGEHSVTVRGDVQILQILPFMVKVCDTHYKALMGGAPMAVYVYATEQAAATH